MTDVGGCLFTVDVSLANSCVLYYGKKMRNTDEQPVPISAKIQ